MNDDLPITMEEPLVTPGDILNWVGWFLAFLGLVFTSICVGLYYAGFFEWLMKHS